MKFEPFKLKIGRRTYTITESDNVLFNGACYLLVSQQYQSGWQRVSPQLSKATLRRGILSLITKLIYRELLCIITNSQAIPKSKI